MGMKVVVNPRIPEREPTIKISSQIELPHKLRAEFDSWLLERFGTKTVYYIVNGSKFAPASIMMHPNNLRVLKTELNNNGFI